MKKITFIYLVLLCLFARQALSQNLVETEPNNAFGDTGIQEIFERENLWGQTLNKGIVRPTDLIDIWHITPTLGTDRYLYHNYEGARVINTSFTVYTNPNVWLVTRAGGHNGTMVSQVELKSSITSRHLLDYTGTNYYYSLEVRGQDGLYSSQLHAGFDSRIMVRSNSTTFCEDPNAVTTITTTEAANSIAINTITAPVGSATGYMVKISDTDSFTDQRDNFDLLPLGNTVYRGLGEQVVYSGTSTSPMINVTGLDSEKEYYIKVYAYTLCDGDFYFYNNTGTSTVVKTCTSPVSPTANITFGNQTKNTITINDFDAISDGYIVKVNTANSFTDLTITSMLPSVNTMYRGSSEQIVYAGTSNTPNITITGLNELTEYFVKVYAYNECLGNFYIENIGTTSSSVTCGTPPNSQISLGSNNTAKTETSVQIEQTKSASVDGVILYANTVDSFVAPTTTNTLPSADAAYSGNGQQVVAISTLANPSIDVTNLMGNTTYYFKAYGYNTCANGDYYFETLGTSHTDVTCGITSNLVSNESLSIIKMNSLGIDGFDAPSDIYANAPTGYVVVMNTSNSFTPLASITSLPTANTTYSNGEQVIYAGNSNTPNIKVNGLLENTEYYFTVYAYKQCDTNIYFQQTGYSFTQKTERITTNLPSDVVLSNVVKESLQIESFTSAISDATAADISGYIIKMNTLNSFSTIAKGNALPAANTIYTSGEQIIYAGNAVNPNVSITGLTENTDYYFTIYGYTLQDGIYNYQTTGYDFSQSTLNINFTTSSLTVLGADVGLSGNASSGGTISYSLVNDTTASSISGNMFSIGNAGSTTVRVSTAANGVYGADSKDFPVTIQNINPVITWNPVSSIILEGVAIDASYLNASADVSGTFEYYTSYNSFTKTYSGRITEGVTSLFYTGYASTIYARFVPNDTNYNIVPTSTTITVNATPRMVEITPNDIVKVIGGTDPTLSSIITNGQLASGHKIWIPLKREPGETAGTYVVSIDETVKAPGSFDPERTCPTGVCIVAPDTDPFGEGNDVSITGDYTINKNTGVFTITNKEEVTIGFIPGELRTRLYTGSSFAITASNLVITATGGAPLPVPTLNYTYSGSDNSGNLYAPSTTPPINAGNYAVKVTVANSDANYFGTVTGNFSISQSGLTITPDTPQVKVYDGTPKVFDVNATGFSGENVPLSISYDIDQGPGVTYTDAPPVEIGTYPVLIRTISLGNYNVYYTAGALTITDKQLVTVNLGNLNQEYDGTPKLVSISSVETSPGVSATPTPNVSFIYEGVNGTFYSRTSTPPINGGQYKVTAQVDASDVNFAGTSYAILVIREKERVTFNFDIDNLDKTYTGASQAVNIVNITDSDEVVITPSYTVSYSGNDLEGNSYGPTPIAPTNAGDYKVTAIISPFDSNYRGSESENFTIEELFISVTADVKTKVYGDTDPIFTYQITSGSLVGGDTFSGSLTRQDTGENVGNYAITRGSLDLGINYELSFVNANLNITTLPITVTADAKSKIYADADPELTYQITTGSLVGSDVFTGNLERVTGEDVGDYVITQGTLALNANYNITFVAANLTVGKRAIEITAEAKTKVYGDADPSLTYQVTNGALAFSDTVSGALVRTTGEIAGDYFVNQGTLTLGANYDLTFVESTFRIDRRFIRILPRGTVQKTYGDADPVFSIPFSLNFGSLAFDDRIEVIGRHRDPGEDVGNYFFGGGLSANITSSNGGESSYQITYMFSRSTYLEIRPRAIEITADATSKAYGETDPMFTYQIRNGTLQFSDAFTGSLSRVAGEDVGMYPINQGDVTLGSNYNITYVSDDLNITPADVIITADAKSKNYGDSDPTLTYTVTTESPIGSDTITGSLERVAGENVGTYAINQGTLTTGANYNLSFVSNNLTVTKRTIEITANTKTKTYGDVDPTLTYQITSGSLVGGDVFTGNLTRLTGENVGDYTINQGTLTLNNNYTVRYISNNVAIVPRRIGVIAEFKTKVYGDTDPTLTHAVYIGSLINGDVLTGDLTRDTGDDIGFYAIRQGTLDNINYDIEFRSENLNITPRAIEITADADSKTYGNSDKALTYQITSGSLINSDVLAGNLEREVGEDVGTYAVNKGILNNTNYNITFISNNYTIYPKSILVSTTAEEKIYGDSDPEFIYRILGPGLVLGDSFSGSLERAVGEDVGTYAITQGTLTLGSNYTISMFTRNFTIQPKAIEITADVKSKVYGEVDPAFTYQITSGSLIGSDVLTGNLTRVLGEDVGNYAINQGSLALNGNYNLSYVDANLEITPASVIIRVDTKSKIYGDSDPVLTYTVTTGSAIGSDAFTGSLERVAGENVGTYAIIQGTLVVDSNYDVTYVGDNLNITAKAIEITADAKTKVYGDLDPALTYQITVGSLEVGDVLTGALTRVSGENVGAHVINQGSLALNSNYTLSYVSDNLMITPALNQSIWDGSNNFVWNDTTNWSGDIVPTTTQNVLIPNVATRPDIASGVVATMNSLTVETSSVLTISEDGAAVIENNFDNSGTVTVTSTVNTSGSLIVKGTSNGTVTYERGGLLANKWSIVSAPVHGQSIKEFVENPTNNIRVNTSTAPHRYAVSYYDDSNASGLKWVYYTVDDLTTNSITFEKGRSYAISRSTDGSVTFTGTLESSDVTKSVTASEWNAIGNPYTAFLPINENSGTNFINDNLSKFNPENVGVYVWDDTQNKYVGKSLVTSEVSLAPGQGFFVKTTTGVSEILFSEAQRKAQPISGGIFARGVSTKKTSIQLLATLNGVTVDTNIKYFNTATEGLDPGYDLGNYARAKFDVYTRLLNDEEGQDFTIQSLPTESIETTILPLGLKASIDDEVSFTVNTKDLPEGVEVFIEDKVLKTFTKINVETNETYLVNITEKTNEAGRFYLHTKQSKVIDIPTTDINDVKVYVINKNTLVVNGIYEGSFDVALYAINGASILSKTLEGNGKNTVNLPDLSTGVYIIMIDSELGKKSEKIIIKN